MASVARSRFFFKFKIWRRLFNAQLRRIVTLSVFASLELLYACSLHELNVI